MLEGVGMPETAGKTLTGDQVLFIAKALGDQRRYEILKRPLKIVMRKNYELKNAALDGTLISVTIACRNSWARRGSTLSSVMRDAAGGCSAHAIRTRISASSRSSCL